MIIRINGGNNDQNFYIGGPCYIYQCFGYICSRASYLSRRISRCSDLVGHIKHGNIVNETIPFSQAFLLGRQLVVGALNICDGQGRPMTTGGGDARLRGQPIFIRTSGPDSNACTGCHAQPREGGSGDFVSNAFVLAQTLDPVTESVSVEFSNQRNTLGMFGSGAIEMLAKEITVELNAQANELSDGEHILSSKGVNFEVTISGGTVIASQGVDTDFIIKPFHQSGVVVSLREFTVNAFNHHHGMQAEERFDLNLDTGFNPDFDGDGVERELTIGDITAATIFQAAMGVSIQVLPESMAEKNVVSFGQTMFEDAIQDGGAGCSSCHMLEMFLENRMFTEPNPFNPEGTFRDGNQSVSFDLTIDGEHPRLEQLGNNGVVVRAYTNLKRHNLCDAPACSQSNSLLLQRKFQSRPPRTGWSSRE
jgi:hypothetical protein